MMIFIGIILIFLGIAVYMINNERRVSNDWLCMIGFLTMMTGALMIGMTMDGTMQFNFKVRYNQYKRNLNVKTKMFNF